MARTLTAIYNEAKEKRDEYLELTEFHNSSKMSVMDAFTWVVAACIWSFECLIDVFKVDLAKDMQYRINGTGAYYVNALLKYQSGDTLQMNEEGTQFSYANIDESKRVVTRASYSEVEEENFLDKKLHLKIATGDPGAYRPVDSAELMAIKAYIRQISFAGTHAVVESREGDILVPRLTVYYDSLESADAVREGIVASINDFVTNLPFDGVVYVQKIVDAIQKTEHVKDVRIDESDGQGIYIAQYDNKNQLVVQDLDEREEPIYLKKVERYFIPNSGYVKQSSGQDLEEQFPLWADSITLEAEEI